MSGDGIRHTADGTAVPPGRGHWPESIDSFPDICGDCRELTSTTEVVRCPKTKGLPISVSFTDGQGVEHTVHVDGEGGTLKLLLPLSDETVKHIIHLYKFIRWTGPDLQETTMIDPKSLVAECTFTYTGGTTFHNHGVRIHVCAYGPYSGHPSPFIVAGKATALWDLVQRKLDLPRSRPHVEEAADPLEKFVATATSVDLEEESIATLLCDILETYSGDYIFEARRNPGLLAKLPSPKACVEQILTAWEVCLERLRSRAPEPMDAMFHRGQEEAAKRFLASVIDSEFGWDRLQPARRTRIALRFAHQVGIGCEKSEYQAGLGYYRKMMLLPEEWPIEDLIFRGQDCLGATQGRLAPGKMLMREVTDVGPLQRLFDACHRQVYTRDRIGDAAVPSRLAVERATHCMNDQVFRQYRETRARLRDRMNGLRNSQSQREALGMYTESFEQEFVAEDLVTTQHLRREAHQSYLNIESLDVEVCNEALVFHGTSAAAAESIAANDFRLNLAGTGAGTLYGRGLYLAQNPSKSDEYCTSDTEGLFTMLVCRALLGRIKYTAEVHPDADQLEVLVKPIPVADRKNLGFYQSVLGDREKCRGTFKEIVVFDDDLVYPEFIVKYRRIYD